MRNSFVSGFAVSNAHFFPTPYFQASPLQSVSQARHDGAPSERTTLSQGSERFIAPQLERRYAVEEMNYPTSTGKNCATLLFLLFLYPLFEGQLKGAEAKSAAGSFKFPCPENEIAHHTAYHISTPIKLDGRLEEPAWQKAPSSPRFVDILSGNRALHDTRAYVVWDDQNLYVAYRIEEPLVHAKYTNRNDPLYYDNDVEFFIAGRDAYYEFEINAFNTIYEVFFIWNDAYEKGGFAAAPEFARSKLKPFNGVGLTNHPRGGRLGQFDWAYPGLKTAVQVDGTVNLDTDRDRGWSVEMILPWKGLAWLARADNRALPPKEGDVWLMDFSRFNTYKEAPPAQDSGGWVWTRHGIWDSHIPECFARIRFTTNDVSSSRR